MCCQYFTSIWRYVVDVWKRCNYDVRCDNVAIFHIYLMTWTKRCVGLQHPEKLDVILLSIFHIWRHVVMSQNDLQHPEMLDVIILSIFHIYLTTCCWCHKTMWLWRGLQHHERHVVDVTKRCDYDVGSNMLDVIMFSIFHIYLMTCCWCHKTMWLWRGLQHPEMLDVMMLVDVTKRCDCDVSCNILKC